MFKVSLVSKEKFLLMKCTCYLLVLFIVTSVSSQPLHYSVSNAHSHNDYENAVPFWAAYHAGFGSIEADIFLVNNNLLVAHEEKELATARTLESLYLQPLQTTIEKQNGFVYSDTTKKLQLLIDVKTDSIATLNKLIEILKNYPTLISNRSLQFVITGGRPVPEKFANYPDYILFDGIVGQHYSKKALAKIVMLSSSFKDYSTWKGVGAILPKEKKRLVDEIKKAHTLHKAIRFWEAPDFVEAWLTFMKLKVDFINTDHIETIASFLQKQGD